MRNLLITVIGIFLSYTLAVPAVQADRNKPRLYWCDCTTKLYAKSWDNSLYGSILVETKTTTHDFYSSNCRGMNTNYSEYPQNENGIQIGVIHTTYRCAARSPVENVPPLVDNNPENYKMCNLCNTVSTSTGSNTSECKHEGQVHHLVPCNTQNFEYWAQTTSRDGASWWTNNITSTEK